MTLNEVATILKLCRVERSKTVIHDCRTTIHVPAANYAIVSEVLSNLRMHAGIFYRDVNVCTVLDSRDVRDKEHVMIKIDPDGKTINIGSVVR